LNTLVDGTNQQKKKGKGKKEDGSLPCGRISSEDVTPTASAREELYLYLEGLVEAALGKQCCIVEKDPETKEPPHVLTNFKKANYELIKGDMHIDTAAEEVWSLIVNLSVKPTHPPFIG
jgi:hypothetical protein